jgi:hypothetical protein
LPDNPIFMTVPVDRNASEWLAHLFDIRPSGNALDLDEQRAETGVLAAIDRGGRAGLAGPGAAGHCVRSTPA